MQLTMPVLIGLVGGAFLLFFLVSRKQSSSPAPMPSTPPPNSPGRGNKTVVLFLLIGIAGAFLFGRSGFGLPFSWSSLSKVVASSQQTLTTLQTSLSSQVSSSAYQSLPIPKIAHQTYVVQAQKDATAVGLVPAVFIRQINQESGFDPNVIGAEGEIGIAQFMPATARSLGINAHDPVASLSKAAHLMASYLKTFNGDYEKALAAYNAGAGTVQQAVAKDGTNWKQAIPLSTQQYIAVILNEGA
jgi:soluble lytic murein transglycosylase-like protein